MTRKKLMQLMKKYQKDSVRLDFLEAHSYVVQPAFDYRLSNNISSEHFTTEMKRDGWEVGSFCPGETIRDAIDEAITWSK